MYSSLNMTIYPNIKVCECVCVLLFKFCLLNFEENIQAQPQLAYVSSTLYDEFIIFVSKVTNIYNHIISCENRNIKY